MDQALMQKYADFVVKMGVNVRPGQTFIIQCPVEVAYFGRACAKAGFEAGAADVVVKYNDELLTRIRYEMGEEAALCDVKPYEVRSYLDYAESEGGTCILNIHADDPNVLAGLDAGRRYLAQRADLLGAIRLPNNAFKKNAGAEVVSDIIFLQKRDRPLDIVPDWSKPPGDQFRDCG